MYKPGLAIGPLVLGTSVSRLPFTGFNTVTYVLLAFGLLVTGLLLARLGHERIGGARSDGRREQIGRGVAAFAVAALGLAILVFSGAWRGFETWSAAHSIQAVTSHSTTVAHSGVVILHESATHASVFALTNQCTVAQILGSLLIGGAPLLLVRRLSALRVATALSAAALVLVVVNLVRLTAIGVGVLAWGQDGFAVAHTYLGSVITFAGTCLAGVTFALVLLARRRGQHEPADGTACS